MIKTVFLKTGDAVKNTCIHFCNNRIRDDFKKLVFSYITINLLTYELK